MPSSATSWRATGACRKRSAPPSSPHHDFSVFNDGSGLSDESCTLIALALLAERIVGTFLRLNEDGEWEKGKGAVAGFFGLTETDLNDIVDDLLFKLDSARKAA